VYWYHPHVREDYAQELGMYGNYLVEPVKYSLAPVNESVALIVDDILFEADGEDIEPFFTDRTNFAIMGRFGDVMLVNGITDYTRSFRPGDVIRFDITNVANVRPFELSIPGARLKLVGSDLSPYEREEFVDNVLITPSERYIVDAYFPTAGTYTLTHTSHDRTLGLMRYEMATFTVDGEPRESHSAAFEELREYTWVQDEARPFDELLFKRPARSLRLSFDPGKLDFGEWMQDLPCHRMPDGVWMGQCTDEKKEAWHAGLSPQERALGGERIHWEDHTFDLNRVTTDRDITWQIVDVETGKANEKIDDWKFETGDVVKLRIHNDPISAHPMQHPFHMHGQRMMTIAINGEPVENRVWKDTILIPVGDTYDIVVELSNPGLWMGHCHIAEHLSSGMMFSFVVGSTYFDAYDALVSSGTHDGHGH
jgi:FtsP/CotA-like multicopper oxidase with cupredoxin domain